ncbi:hypothetical protein PV325_001160 [Microctonus aethiopoides]|uniref:Large ribosomal subunit protein mL39 n=1 Tax=Microctonus aethiopoides TaxID=144406 RepID=A0AA39KTP6_9HYME|nr:hypothetical protein PV325_001160 [Microctonus aethiopoides]KAK0092988.1 hypothetical protein PV326_000179 [Microctonus aethiopoides]KAK0173379.1 hypothetical protein PV328_006589 [Microctonus aethiopoides]
MIGRYTKFYSVTFGSHCPIYSRCMSSLTKAEAKKKRNAMFDEEKKRQRTAIGRIEKIKVIYDGPEEEVTLLMNKDISTPYECARHISEGMAKLSALASVDGVPWDMHKPLISNCSLKLSTMKTPHDKAVNNAFWRSCSFMLGAVIDSAFKDDIVCHLHSFTSPNIKSGSFLYDVHLDLPDWNPTSSELKAISSIFAKLIQDELPIERLEVHKDIASDMFEDNPFKSKQIPDIALHNDDKIILYRAGDHIDISKGPMVGNTNIVGRFTLTAIHNIQNECGESLRRFQGVALPQGMLVNHYVYNILEERAKKLNQSVWMPQRFESESEEKQTMALGNN